LRVTYETKLLSREAASLDAAARKTVLRAVQEVCRHKHWTLYAVHVRATHIHVVVAAQQGPEEVLTILKAYASRALNQSCGRRLKRWTRHGSTRRLWSPVEVDLAMDYVLRQQGKPTEVYEFVDPWSDVL
jgi:REP element-mobilizing transposase RayT